MAGVAGGLVMFARRADDLDTEIGGHDADEG